MKRNIPAFLILLFVLFFFIMGCKKKDNSGGIQASLPGSWEQTNGPCTGPVNSLAINGNTITACGALSVVTTQDLGKTWEGSFPASYPYKSINAMVTRNDTIMAVGDGLFRSVNKGQTWTQIAADKLTCCIGSIAWNCNIIALSGNLTDPVWISSDNGNTWRGTGSILPGYGLWDVAVSGQKVFASVDSYGVYATADMGLTWTAVNNGLTGPEVRTLVSNGQDLLAGSLDGIFLSKDQGQNWSLISGTTIVGRYINCIATWGTAILVGLSDGLFYSPDYGQTWINMTVHLDFPWIESVAISGSTLLAGGRSGIHYSPDNGQTWSVIGFPGSNVKALSPNGQDLFCVGDAEVTGIYVSGDIGSNWRFLNSPITYYNITNMAWSSSDMLVCSDSGVYRSPDRGMSWVRCSNGLPHDYVISLGAIGDNYFAGTNEHGMYLSHDRGQNWSHVTTPAPDYKWILAFYPSGNGMYAGTFAGGVLFTSDYGNTWSAMNTGFPEVTCINSFASIGSTLFAGSLAGVYRSDNNGQSWSLAGASSGYVIRGLAVYGQEIFAATDKNGILMSADYGNSWWAVNTGFPQNLRLYSIAVKDSWLFVGTMGEGVWKHALQ